MKLCRRDRSTSWAINIHTGECATINEAASTQAIRERTTAMLSLADVVYLDRIGPFLAAHGTNESSRASSALPCSGNRDY